MTVIVADRKTMSGDSMTVHGGTVVGSHRKVHAVRDMVVGYAGDLDSGLAFLDWSKRGMGSRGKPRDLSEEFMGLVLDGSGLYVYTYLLVPMRIEEDFWAIGGGAQAAMGAMRMGATTKRAVEIACAVAPDCALPVTVEKLPV